MWCAMPYRCLPSIIQYIPCCYFLILLHIIYHPQKVYLRHLPSLYFSPNNQLPCSPHFHSWYIIRWIAGLLYSCYSPPRNHMICGNNYHSSCMRPRRLCSCFSFFIHNLVLEPSIQNLVFHVYCFRLTLFSITNIFISWSTCMPYLRYWHYKILSRACIILLVRQIHVPSSHIHLYHILLDFL